MNINKKMQSIFTNRGTCRTPEEVQKGFPEFYEANKDAIDNKRVLVFEDPCTEVGMILNTETLETMFIDFRA